MNHGGLHRMLRTNVLLAIISLALLVGTVYADHFILTGHDEGFTTLGNGTNPWTFLGKPWVLDGTTVK